jgi:uncharacterized protein DUF6308
MHNRELWVARSPAQHSIEGTWTDRQIPEGLGARYPMVVKAANGDLFVFVRETAGDLNPAYPSQMLSVRFPSEVAIGLLDGDLGRQMTSLLSKIPTDVDLGTERAEELVSDGSHAHQAWHLVERQREVGYVIAGKLMARKRPRLIPVYDRVLTCRFGAPDHVWLRLHRRLAADGGKLRDELAALRAQSRIPAAVSLLRVLDVILWMEHRHMHQPSSCPGFAAVALN